MDCVVKGMTQHDIALAEDLSLSFWNRYVSLFFHVSETVSEIWERLRVSVKNQNSRTGNFHGFVVERCALIYFRPRYCEASKT